MEAFWYMPSRYTFAEQADSPEIGFSRYVAMRVWDIMIINEHLKWKLAS